MDSTDTCRNIYFEREHYLASLCKYLHNIIQYVRVLSRCYYSQNWHCRAAPGRCPKHPSWNFKNNSGTYLVMNHWVWSSSGFFHKILVIASATIYWLIIHFNLCQDFSTSCFTKWNLRQMWWAFLVSLKDTLISTAYFLSMRIPTERSTFDPSWTPGD